MDRIIVFRVVVVLLEDKLLETNFAQAHVPVVEELIELKVVQNVLPRMYLLLRLILYLHLVL